MSFVVATSVLAISLVACVTDVHSRRIPNLLTFGAAFAGLAFHSWTGGWAGAQAATLGWLAGTALYLPFFLLGGMGGGDVKLVAALGAWLGPREAFYLGLYSWAAGGVLAIVVALLRGYLTTAIRNVGNLVWQWCLTGIKPVPSLTLEHGTGPRLAFALPIFAGAVVTIWHQ